jgi:hypothetical protein
LTESSRTPDPAQGSDPRHRKGDGLRERLQHLWDTAGWWMRRYAYLPFGFASLPTIVGGLWIATLPYPWAWPAGVTVGAVGGILWGLAWMLYCDGRTDRPALVALRAELLHLWGDLSAAIRYGGPVQQITSRIKTITAMVGPTPWDQIDLNLLEHGHYHRVHGEMGLVLEVNMSEVARLADQRRNAAPLTPIQWDVLHAVATYSTLPVTSAHGAAMGALIQRGMLRTALPADVDRGSKVLSVTDHGHGYLRMGRPVQRPARDLDATVYLAPIGTDPGLINQVDTDGRPWWAKVGTMKATADR